MRFAVSSLAASSEPRRRRAKSGLPVAPAAVRLWAAVWCAACFSGCVFVSADLNPFRSRPEGLVETTVSGTGKEKVLLIELGQLISSVPPRSLLGMEQRPSVLARIREELEVAEKDPRVRAVVLRINSPGGTVTASDTLYHELAAFRSRTGRPLVAHIGEVGTSGAYYAALAADEIIASPTSVTGSVGVLWMGVNVAGLMQKFGIEDQTLKAGELKDAGSPLRPMSERERVLLQGLLEAMHKRFLATVRERRPGMPEGALEMVGDGRVVYADEARSLGLVDGIGYLEDAIARARERAGLARARVVMYRRPSQYAENIYSLAGVTGGDVNLFRLDLGLLWGRGDFYYLWSPGLQAGEGAITYP